MRLIKYICVLMILALPAGAVEITALNQLKGGVKATVVRVVDGDTVILDSGRQVRLVGIQAPKLPLGRSGFQAWPLAAEAKTYLETVLLGQVVEIRLGDTQEDRHGRILAHVVRVSDGLWVQGDLLAQGLARVYTFPDNRKLAPEMLAVERHARTAGMGIWAVPFYGVRNADTVRGDIGSFSLVEDRIVDVAHVKKRIYLNFGADWRSDFTIQINAHDEPAFTALGIDLMALKGHRIRVRGWVKDKNGPMIELDHPQRLEMIDP
jgi:endonuclease YncB( thermonuclease family)